MRDDDRVDLAKNLDAAARVASQLPSKHQHLDDVGRRQEPEMEIVPLGVGNVRPQLAENPFEFLDFIDCELAPCRAESVANQFNGALNSFGPLDLECSNTEVLFVAI